MTTLWLIHVLTFHLLLQSIISEKYFEEVEQNLLQTQNSLSQVIPKKAT